ncbi:MAG: hypothetical protein OES21_11350 [Myxococcales bacterium]|jgi:hypothetical protein|nr:hypothetical protein [Myxococcales bacterium]
MGTLVATGFQQETPRVVIGVLCEERYLGGVRRLIPGIAVLLAYAITPGAGEMIENAAHFVVDGHVAHATHEAEEEPCNDSHGCSGPFQTCPCHGTSAFVVDDGPIEVAVAELEIVTLHWFVADLEAVGVMTGVFRPPIS